MRNRDSQLVDKILQHKRRRNAIILAHNYQLGEVQDIADFVGDSLELSQNAAKTNADVIVFCGVHFMVATASILCPDKIVLLPDMHAGCPMADMVDDERLRAKKWRIQRLRWFATSIPRLKLRRSQMSVAPLPTQSRS